MKAFEEGLSNIRDATNQTDRREIRKAGGQVKDNASNSQKPGNSPRAGGSGDGDGDGDDGEDGDHDSDSDSFPRLRKKQRRATGKRESITNTFHVSVYASNFTVRLYLPVVQKEIRKFLELHGLFPPKDDPNYTPQSVSAIALARFRAEGKTAGPKIGDAKAPLRLNWEGSLKYDTWNVATIDLLAHQLHKIFAGREDKDAFKHLSTDVESLRKAIVNRLIPIKTRICKPQERVGNKQRSCQRMRRASRRKNVSRFILIRFSPVSDACFLNV